NLNNMLVVNAGTFCSSKTRGKTTQCFNLIQAENSEKNGNGESEKIEDGGWKVRVSRVFPQGNIEFITETVM
ncbi:MAG: metallophosphoesterase, partial [Methanosarcina mazei]